MEQILKSYENISKLLRTIGSHELLYITSQLGPNAMDVHEAGRVCTRTETTYFTVWEIIHHCWVMRTEQTEFRSETLETFPKNFLVAQFFFFNASN